MVLEMCLLLLTPIGGGAFAFVLLAMNRILSGLAEAAASGADEALCYDSLQQAGLASEWSAVLVRVQQATSIAFFFALMLGAAAYDPSWLQPLCAYFGYKLTVDASAFVKLPVFLTLLSSLLALCMAYRMQESSRHRLLSPIGTFSPYTIAGIAGRTLDYAQLFSLCSDTQCHDF